MRATIFFFLRPVPNNQLRVPYMIFPHKITTTRVPGLGEIVSLGNDQHGVAADYVVELVHHCPDQPNEIDAEVYMRRVSITKEKMRAAGVPSEHPEAEWDADAWPQEPGDE